MEKAVNEEKLKKFYETIKDLPIITFPVAKRMLQEDKSVKTVNEIFLGSLHAVYNYLADRDYASFDSGAYDMDDIINSLLAEWIEIIKKGDLERSTSYSNAIQGIIVGSKLKENIGITTAESTGGLNLNFLKTVLPDLISNDAKYTYNDYTSDLNRLGLSRGYFSRELYYYFVLVIEVLRNSEFRDSSKSFIRENTSLLMDYAYKYLNPPAEEEEADLEMERVMENEIDKAIVEEIMANPKLSAREKMVATLIYGLNGDLPHTYDEVSESLSIPKSTVQLSIKNFLTKTRRFVVMKGINKTYTI